MKKRLIILAILPPLLAGCATKNHNGTVLLDATGKPIQQSFTVDSKEYYRSLNVRSAEESNKAYYTAQATKYGNVKTDTGMALLAAIEGMTGAKAPANYNDVRISEVRAGVERSKLRYGLIGKGVQTLVMGSVAKEGLGLLAGLAKQGGVVINGDNNQVRGTNTGENGSAYYKESMEGIRTEPVTVDGLTAGGGTNVVGSDETTTSQCPEGFNDYRPELPEDDPATVLGGYTCSNGAGGTTLPTGG